MKSHDQQGGSVVSLTVHRNTMLKRKRREVWESARRKVNSLPKDVDGYVLVSYQKSSEGVRHRTNYSVRDPMDVYLLEEIVALSLSQTLSE